MSKRLRYQNPKIIQHIASHYILGTQTDAVRRQTTRLMQHYPLLKKTILEWQAHLGQLDTSTPEIPPPKTLWRKIEQQLFATPAPLAWYQLPKIWLCMGLSSVATLALASLMVVIMGLMPTEQIKPMGYLAVMSPVTNETVDNGSDIGFVLTAYKGNANKPSSLHIQWNQRSAPLNTEEWQLYSLSRESQQLVSLGSMAQIQQGQPLSRPQWLAIKDSQLLRITKGDEILYEGPCLQLSNWAKPS